MDHSGYQFYGKIGDVPWYRVDITHLLHARMSELVRKDIAEIPDWLDLGPASAHELRTIATPDPEWWVTEMHR